MRGELRTIALGIVPTHFKLDDDLSPGEIVNIVAKLKTRSSYVYKDYDSVRTVHDILSASHRSLTFPAST